MLLIPMLLLMLYLCIDMCVSNALSFDDYFFLSFLNGREKYFKKFIVVWWLWFQVIQCQWHRRPRFKLLLIAKFRGPGTCKSVLAIQISLNSMFIWMWSFMTWIIFCKYYYCDLFCCFLFGWLPPLGAAYNQPSLWFLPQKTIQVSLSICVLGVRQLQRAGSLSLALSGVHLRVIFEWMQTEGVQGPPSGVSERCFWQWEHKVGHSIYNTGFLSV